MSIQDNTSALQSILAAVNELPEAGGGGVTVQTATGTFRTSGGVATIACGFQPDIFFITQNATYSGYTNSACFAFAAAGTGKVCAGTWNSAGNYIEFYGDRTSTGAEVEVLEYDDSWDTDSYNATFSYTAIKYT